MFDGKVLHPCYGDVSFLGQGHSSQSFYDYNLVVIITLSVVFIIAVGGVLFRHRAQACSKGHDTLERVKTSLKKKYIKGKDTKEKVKARCHLECRKCRHRSAKCCFIYCYTD